MGPWRGESVDDQPGAVDVKDVRQEDCRRDDEDQAVASWETFAGWRIRMALPKGSRMPMSVP